MFLFCHISHEQEWGNTHSVSCTHQLKDVWLAESPVDSDLPLDLVVIQLRQFAPVVHLDGNLDARGLANGQVNSRGITATELLREGKLVGAPAVGSTRLRVGAGRW